MENWFLPIKITPFMITERKINYRFLVGLFWIISNVSWGQVTYPSATAGVSYSHTSLVNQSSYVMRAYGCRSRPCTQLYKKVYLVVEFSLADDYADITAPGSVISSEVDVILKGNYCRLGTPPYEFTQHLEIDTDNPRQVYKIDFTSYYFYLSSLGVNVDNYVVPVGYEGSISLSVGYEFDFLFEAGGKTTTTTNVTPVDPTTNSAHVFEWKVDCGHFEMYELQLLKLYNNSETNALTNDPSIVSANVDWDQALTIQTHSWKQSLRLTLGEGTGYYTWRVRGIGNQFKGGEANPQNWGTWSTHIPDGSTNINPASYTAQPHTFYYNQFDEDKNWMYSRAFIEGEKELDSDVKIGEQIAYANGLLQSKQSQSIMNTNHQVVATESVYDYSGRGALSSIGAPVYGQSSLGFKENFFLSTDGTAYDASNFDENSNYKEPEASKLDGVGNGFGYYSDYNTTETYVASAADPSNGNVGYPFARTRFSNDGRVKESSGVGYDHRMYDGLLSETRTTRTFYGSVAEAELLRVLGNEAPDAASVHKVITIDPNKTTSIAYINKVGQTLFTCLGMPATPDYALLDLDSQSDAIYNVEEYVDPLIKTGGNVMERVKDLILTSPTTLTIDYQLATNIIQNSCANFCTTCDYQLEILVRDKETNSILYYYDELINPTTSCTEEGNLVMPHTVSLVPGEYRIEQRLKGNNIPSGSVFTKLEEHVDALEEYLTENILGSAGTPTGDLYEVMTHISDNNLVALYAHLDALPNATLVTQLDGSKYYDVDITIGTGAPCLTIQIPVLECESTDCSTNGIDYLALLTEYGLSTDILKYEYAQGVVHTYTSGDVNMLINNMIDDGYEACQLWNCWRSLILGYEAALEVEASLNTTPEGAGYQYFFMNSFLDCARATKYPEGDYPLISSTIEPEDIGTDAGYIWSAHNHFYYESGTYLNCGYVLDPSGGVISYPVNNTTYTNEQLQNFYSCISNIVEGGDLTVYTANIYESIQSNCEEACESKRSAFEEEVINLYRSEGAHIEGDEYEYVLNPSGVPMYVPDNNLPYSGPYDYTLEQISCAVDLLVDYCLGNCEVSDPITAIQQSNIETVLTSNLVVSSVNVDLCKGVMVSSEGMPEYMISWDLAVADDFSHSASPEMSLIDMEKDGNGHVAVLAGNRVTKYGSTGQVIWTKSFDAELPGVTVQGVQKVSGGYLLSTSRFQLVRLDGSGNILWIQNYSAEVGPSEEQYFSKPIQTESGDVYILWYAMVSGDVEDVLIHTDDLGNFDWKYTYGVGTLSNNDRSIINLMNESVMIGSGNGTDVYKVNNLGNLVWTAGGYSDPFVNIRGMDQIEDNKWCIVGNNSAGEAIVYQIESNGTLLNSGVPDVFASQTGRDITASTDGDYLVATTSEFGSTFIQFVVTQMTGGTADWSEDFGSDGEELNCQLINYSNGRILLGGTSPNGSLSTTEGYKTNTTSGGNFWETWFVKFRKHNDACHYTEFCVEWENTEIDTSSYPEPTVFELIPCEEVQSNYLLGTINAQVANYVNAQKTALAATYEEQCLVPENINDNLKLTYQMAGYHYMVYYYDRAGNLVKTVPPQGVQLQDVSLPAVQNRSTIPNHTHVTDYQYNSLGQMTRSHTPDGGETKFYYDKLSRLRFSQNAEQVTRNAYSYIKYDELGRTIESGESTLNGVGGAFITETENQTFPSSSTTDWTRSIYTTPSAGVDYKGEAQQFLRNRISYVYNDEGAYTYYSYDPHGNVEWVIQEIPSLDRFSIAYEYDLLSGNVLQVAYNDHDETNLDKFYHRYAYDADNRLVRTETSTDLVIWDVDETNTYNSVGMMNRKITGQDGVQGTDYVNTIQGWLKGINHSSLDKAKDPGRDGLANTVAEDAFGMVLNYFEGDYRRTSGIGTAYTSSDEHYLAGTHDLYNGNISSWASRIPDQTTGGTNIEHAGKITGFTYRYDELQRIKSTRFNTLEASDPGATWVGSADYKTTYSFDANGNITYLTRNAYANAPDGVAMDNMEYDYDHLSGGVAVAPTASNYAYLKNQLNMVEDGIDAAGIDDIDGAQSYGYDEIGRLVADPAEQITTIRWNAFQKVDAIYKTTGERIFFKYDGLGNRIAKMFVHPSDQEQSYTTYYVRDAAGNNMATYTKNYVPAGATYTQRFKLTEHEIYGSDRMGLRNPTDVVVKEIDAAGVVTDFSETPDDFYTRSVGEKMYELKDHLGNVRSVITDRKLYDGTDYTASIVSIADYYPYGMQLPGRHQSSNLYRYGFQGQEKDDEVKGEGNSVNYKYRMHDPRIGRFFAEDPLKAKYPHYTPYQFSGNKVIHMVELEGLEEGTPPSDVTKYLVNPWKSAWSLSAIGFKKVGEGLTWLDSKLEGSSKFQTGLIFGESKSYFNGGVDFHPVEGSTYNPLDREKAFIGGSGSYHDTWPSGLGTFMSPTRNKTLYKTKPWIGKVGRWNYVAGMNKTNNLNGGVSYHLYRGFKYGIGNVTYKSKFESLMKNPWMKSSNTAMKFYVEMKKRYDSSQKVKTAEKVETTVYVYQEQAGAMSSIPYGYTTGGEWEGVESGLLYRNLIRTKGIKDVEGGGIYQVFRDGDWETISEEEAEKDM